jgi:soluble lytic murein transglycosylase
MTRFRQLIPFFILLVLMSLLFAASSQARGYPEPTVDLASDDQRFLALRDAASKEDAARALQLSKQLAGYVLSDYVDYYLLKSHLRDASENEITAFLARHVNSAIADRLRNDWLILLGRKSEWATFDTQYVQFVLNDDVQVKCYALLSRFNQGQRVANEARDLLTSASVYGEGCYPLFSNLVESKEFSRDDMWNQIRWAAESNPTAALQLAKLAGLEKTLKTLTKPTHKIAAALSAPLAKSVDAHQAALVLLGYLAKTAPQKALDALLKMNRYLTEAERALAWAQIALPAAQKLQPEATTYWKKANGVKLSAEGYQWRVRAALRALDWANVKAGIEAMPQSLSNQPAWIYWLGRAYLVEGKVDIALSMFRRIAELPNFYGQLALEECGAKIMIPAVTPVQVLDLVALSNNVGLQYALKFYALNLRLEGNREWNWQLRAMSEQQLLAAAEFARQNNLLDRMVSTSDRTKTIFDYTQRFPSPYQEIMAQSTQSLKLDIAWVYGVIRQESRFILNARSSAGAHGLMQVMPGTARYVAKKLKWSDIDLTKIHDIKTNIRLGANYLNIVLNNLNGSEVLASAGYNAGPNRARAWRASLTTMVEGAIFAETIPFSETRDYVKNVLCNTSYYAAIFLGKPQSLKERLGVISPFVDVPPERNLTSSFQPAPLDNLTYAKYR